MKKHSAR